MHHSYAQTFEWVRAIGSPVQDEGRSITSDASGNIYTTGTFRYTADFDPHDKSSYELTTPAGDEDIFVQKLNTDGDFVWAIQMGGAGWDGSRAITIDIEGNIYVVGYFSGSADFDPNPEVTHNLDSDGAEDIFIVKLTENGTFVWAKQIGGSAPDDATSVTTDSDGNAYFTGKFQGTVDFNPGSETHNLNSNGNEDIFVCKLDASGNFVWAKSIGGSSTDTSLSIVLDATGNIYTSGYFAGSMDADPGNGTETLNSNGSYSDIFICKWTNDGDLVWAKSYGDNGFDIGYDLALDGLGHLYATGRFEGTVDFDSGAGIQNVIAIGGADIYLLKLSTDGDIFWIRSFGSTFAEWGQGVDVDSAGDVYVTGFYLDTVDFDASGETAYLTSAGGEDIFVCKYDNLGELAWAKSMGGPNSLFGDRGQDIHLDMNNNIYTTGWFYDVADFDPSNDAFPVVSQGSFDVFTHKLNQPAIGIEETESNDFVIAYPNPTEDGLFRIAPSYHTTIAELSYHD